MKVQIIFVIIIILTINYCGFIEKSLIPPQPTLIGDWKHTYWSHDRTGMPVYGPTYKLTIFPDSTYLLMRDSNQLGTGKVATKNDTLIFYKDNKSSRNFSFIFENKTDVLKLEPLNEAASRRFFDFIGHWSYR